MTNILGKMFPDRSGQPAPTNGDAAYEAAMCASAELLERMREASGSNDPARAVMADIWAQNRNMPFLTAVVETVEEMKSSIEQKPTDR